MKGVVGLMKESEDARWAGVKSEEVGRIALSPPQRLT